MRSTFARRLLRTALLKPLAYEEVEEDTRARSWWQPVLVVVFSSLGMAMAELGRLNLPAAFSAALVGLAGWLLWSGLVFVIGVRLLPSPATYATWGQLLRTTGFAAGPGILGFLGVFPVLTGFSFAVLALWILTAAAIGVKQALDYQSNLRALAVCLLGWAANFILVWAVIAPR